MFMSKNVFTNMNQKYIKIAFRFLGITMLICFLCLMPSTRTYAKEQTIPVTTILNSKSPRPANSSVEKMEENNATLEQMKKEQKELNQTYKEKILLYKNSSSTLTETQTKELQQINNDIRKKNKRLKKNLSNLSTKQKKYQELDPNSAKAKKQRKTIISLQNDTIKRMKKINLLFKREIEILDNIQ